MTREETLTIKRQLLKAKKITVVSHYNPDGDAVGSSLALYHFFLRQGYEITVVLPNPFPSFYAWMPGSQDIIIAERNGKQARQLILNADMLFIVDMNAPHRSGKQLEEPIIDSSAFKILIDHHVKPDIKVNSKLSIPAVSSTCELIYGFITKQLKQKDRIELNMAECLYVGIITDTGSLSYGCNSPSTYMILKSLFTIGVDGEKIHRLIYDNYEISRIKLLGLSLSDRLTILSGYATAFIRLSKQDLIDNQYKIGDTEGFVNYGLCMKEVQFAAIFIEGENRIRVSFRSKGNFDVNMFARTHFNGGGHRNAAAAYHYDNLENTIAYFESLLPQYQVQLLTPYTV